MNSTKYSVRLNLNQSTDHAYLHDNVSKDIKGFSRLGVEWASL